MADPSDQYVRQPAGEPPAASRRWLRAPDIPPGTALRLTTVIGAGGLTPEVFELMRDVMANDDKFGGELGATTCPHLTYCGTKSGSCPELTGCNHYTAVVQARVEDSGS